MNPLLSYGCTWDFSNSSCAGGEQQSRIGIVSSDYLSARIICYILTPHKFLKRRDASALFHCLSLILCKARKSTPIATLGRPTNALHFRDKQRFFCEALSRAIDLVRMA